MNSLHVCTNFTCCHCSVVLHVCIVLCFVLFACCLRHLVVPVMSLNSWYHCSNTYAFSISAKIYDLG